MTFKNKVTPNLMAIMVNPPKKMNLSQIGKKYGVSRQRVHQVYSEYKKNNPGLFVEEEEPNKEDIQSLLKENITLKEIAKRLDITPGKLYKLMKKYGLRKTYIKDTLDHDKLFHLFVKKKKTDREIAEAYDCSQMTVMALRAEFGIKAKDRKPINEILTEKVFVELYVKDELLLSQIAELFNTNIANIIDLKKEYQINEKYSCGENKIYRARGVSEVELLEIEQKLLDKGVIF